ncbi:TPA: PAS domain S-box protein [Pseudomonas aeruginosa]|nr:PAS domain S-box protein [Pseudomonas aeruginosa]
MSATDLPGDSVRSVGNVILNSNDNPQTHSEKMARIILDRMYHFAGLLDRDGTILEINLPALEGAGLRIEDIRGTPFWEARWFAVSQESKALQHQLVQRAAAGEFIRCDLEVYGEGSGEQTIVTDYSLTPLRDNHGEVAFLLAEGRNITSKKKYEQEIARKNSELEKLVEQIRKLDEQKSRFFSNLSHELRTPLSLILGPVDEMLVSSEFSERQHTNLASIRRNAVTLLRHVNELLDLAKVDAGKLQLAYERIDIKGLVEDIAAHFEAHAKQRRIRCAVLSPGPILVEADPERIGHVVFNLMANAFNATPDGGRISCRVEIVADRLLLTVSDSGPGIPPEMRQHIFERFQQGLEDHGQARAGSGLGLAIVKEFIELHGGTVTVGEAPGSGAIFQVEIPAFAPPQAVVRSGSTGEQAFSPDMSLAADIDIRHGRRLVSDTQVDRPRILIVEDNEEMLHLIARTLSSEFSVECAGNGEQGLGLMLANPPDLVITDLMMPGMSGEKLIRLMREEAQLTQIPVLVLSARADEELRMTLLANMVQDYVTKPFFIPELLSRVRNLVMTRRARLALQDELKTHNADLVQLTRELISGRQAIQRSLEAQQKSERRWRAIHENSAVGIAVVDLQWLFVSANPAFCRMLGYTEEELLGHSVLEHTHADDRNITDQRLHHLLDGRLQTYHHQKRFLHRDGHSLWTRSSVSVIPGSGDAPPLMIGVVEDIDEHKRAEHELEQARLELARVMRVTAMGELVASITHELNQPLAAIVANSHACRRWLNSNPPNLKEGVASMEAVVRDSQRAAEVVLRLRKFMRRGENQQELLDLSGLVEEVLDYVRESLVMQNISLQTMLPTELPMVLADRVQLQQVVLNLVLNAIEAIQAASPSVPRLTLRICRRPDAGLLQLEVEDNGCGVPPSQTERIFEPFYTTKNHGMGMGLAICRTILEAHGGQLNLIPPPDNGSSSGSVFQVVLPTDQGAPL